MTETLSSPDSHIPPTRIAEAFERSVNELNDLLATAYRSGFEDGTRAADERVRAAIAILQAAQGPMISALSGRLTEQAPAGPRPVRKYSPRAPRGSVRAAIFAVLQAQPGLTELEVGAAAERHDAGVSSRSVGGELRRKRNRLYRIDGGKWFLIAQAGAKETAEPKGSAGSLHSATQEDSDDPETAIAA